MVPQNFQATCILVGGQSEGRRLGARARSSQARSAVNKVDVTRFHFDRGVISLAGTVYLNSTHIDVTQCLSSQNPQHQSL